MKHIEIGKLRPHPKNPRLAPREDVIEQLAAQMASGFDEAHALIVRPQGDIFEIISGHHRRFAAEKAGLASVPCWVREMSDDDAYMALALNNAQGELSPLEIGLHALGSGLDQKAYADKIGLSRTTLQDRWYAAEVASVPDIRHADITKRWQHLSAIHAAPRWLWSALVAALIAHDWTVEDARKAAQKFKGVATPPEWTDVAAIAEAAVAGETSIADVSKFFSLAERSIAAIVKAEEDAERFTKELLDRWLKARPGKLSDAVNIYNSIAIEQSDLIRERQQADLLRTKRDEEVKARIARLRRNVSLDEWKELAPDERSALLNLASADNVGFNKQENDSIEWAQWSWNPVTGCQHNCPYCYARDIANDWPKMARAYPNRFEPTFRPSMLLAPRFVKVPQEAKTDTRYRNVFTCSMADLFGRWVPAEWIEAVLREIRNAPQWNFLCLTKFPKRMAEFDIPANAWMGTSVDLQARVANAESAFEHVKAGVRWLSVEPMLEPLKFKHLERFNWIVIGGASPSKETPAWHPPFDWILDLLAQARAANVKVYFKTNLLKKRLLELPFDAAIPSETAGPSKEFSYLGREKAVA